MSFKFPTRPVKFGTVCC